MSQSKIHRTMSSRPNVLKEFGGRFDLTGAGLHDRHKKPWYVRASSHFAKASSKARFSAENTKDFSRKDVSNQDDVDLKAILLEDTNCNSSGAGATVVVAWTKGNPRAGCNVLKEFGGQFDLTGAGLHDRHKKPWYARAWSHFAKASSKARFSAENMKDSSRKDVSNQDDVDLKAHLLEDTSCNSSGAGATVVVAWTKGIPRAGCDGRRYLWTCPADEIERCPLISEESLDETRLPWYQLAWDWVKKAFAAFREETDFGHEAETSDSQPRDRPPSGCNYRRANLPYAWGVHAIDGALSLRTRKE